jgi:hypothetical protein
MNTLNLLFAFVFLFVNTLFSQNSPIRVRLKENITTTEQHINKLTELLKSDACFNNASFTSSYPDTETPLLKRVYDIRVTSDTTLARHLLLKTDYFEYVVISKTVKLLQEVCDLTFPETNDNYNNGVNYALKMIGAEHTNNNLGMAGIGYNCNLALRRIPNTNSETSHGVVQTGSVKVINASLTGTGRTDTTSEIQILIAATEETTQNGTTLVLTAGNYVYAFHHEYVANIPGVIMVSSVNSGKGYAHNVNVDLCAPGKKVRVAGLYGNNSYIVASGTSLTAPYVDGALVETVKLSVNK